MKLGYLTILVRDLDASVTFYRKLAGLQELRRFNPGIGEIVFLANAQGETMLELIQCEGAQTVSVQGMVLSFCAGDRLEEVWQTAHDFGYTPSGIIDNPPKPKHFTVPDPDGIPVEFSV